MGTFTVAALLLAFTLPAWAQDTSTVKSNGAAVWRNPRLIEEIRIGVLEGDDRYIFGLVTFATMVGDGSIWIVDDQGPRVRIFDRNGRYVRDVYRPGAGPGEIRSVTGIHLTPDGRVAIWDVDNHRVSLYRPNGNFISAFASNSSWWGKENLRVDTAGRFWVYTSVRNPACIRRITAPNGTISVVGTEGPGCGRPAYLRYSRAGVLLDTVFVPTPQVTERVPSFSVMLPEGEIHPFVSEWDYSLSPHGYFVTAHSLKYALNIVRGVGRRNTAVTRIERDYEPVRLIRDERVEWQGRADYHTRRRPGGPSAGVQVPELKPPLRSVSVDSDGRIWVDRYVTAVKRPDIKPVPGTPERPQPLTWLEPRTFDVFEPTGRFLGTVAAPFRAKFLMQRGHVIWALVRGEFDENYIVRYRLATN